MVRYYSTCYSVSASSNYSLLEFVVSAARGETSNIRTSCLSLAVLRVEKWLEELHDRRRLIEASFRSRKTQLEQCLALALLATDLRDLEEILNDRIAALAGSCDHLGDSASSVELLLFELKKLQDEAKVFDEKTDCLLLKIINYILYYLIYVVIIILFNIIILCTCVCGYMCVCVCNIINFMFPRSFRTEPLK